MCDNYSNYWFCVNLAWILIWASISLNYASMGCICKCYAHKIHYISKGSRTFKFHLICQWHHMINISKWIKIRSSHVANVGLSVCGHTFTYLNNSFIFISTTPNILFEQFVSPLFVNLFLSSTSVIGFRVFVKKTTLKSSWNAVLWIECCMKS